MSIHEIIKDKNIEIKQSLAEKCLSVSDTLKTLYEGFDREAKSDYCSKRDFDVPGSKYYQMTPEAIKEMWSAKGIASLKYGKLLDNYSDMVLNESKDMEEWKLNNSYEYDKRLHNLCDGFDNFYNILMRNTDYKYVTREEPMFIVSKKSGKWIAGRFDCLFYSPSLDKYLLIDWKTNEKIEKSNSFAKMYGPLFDKDDCDYNKYTIQVMLYKKALIETYEIANENNIDIIICQFTDNAENKFISHNAAFEYNSELLDNVIDFAYKKIELNKNKHE